VSQKLPDTLVIISFVLLTFAILTWIIPAGQFEKEIVNGKETVLPDSYHEVKSNPQSVGDLLKAPVKGFDQSAIIIAFVLFVGGVFGILNKTGAIESSLKSMLSFTTSKPQYKRIVIPFMVSLFAITGATFGLSEEVLVFVLITVPLFLSLGYDSMLGLAVPIVGTACGFAGAVTNPFTVGIAQGIAEVQLFSGWEYRFLILVTLTTISCIYLDWYARKIMKNNKLSPVYEIDIARVQTKTDSSNLEFTFERKMVMLIFALTIIMLIIGATTLNWYIYEISALFLACAILSSMVYGMGTNEAISSFTEGAKEMLPASLVIAFSKGIIILATDGRIIDTILHAVSKAMEGFPALVSAEIMYVVQALINVLVPSGSGQAALTIPIMGPLGDILGLTRQTVVLIFQMGDGLDNMIIPTSGVTMGSLALAKIPYEKWVKWLFPLFTILFLVQMLFLIPPTVFFFYGPN
jgi:uncharacterized ion transporter superfamily protein YfcC